MRWPSPVLSIYFYLAAVDSARILGVYPTPSISHQVVFRALTLELVKRGHEVVVITTDPISKNKEPIANLTEIDISESYDLIPSILKNDQLSKYVKRGVIIDSDAIRDGINVGITDLFHCIFNYTVVTRFIEDKTQKFDLVIVESISYTPLIFGKIYNAPVVLFSSLYGSASNYETVGAVARHPLLHPYFIFRSKLRNLSLLDKIEQLYVEYKLWKFDQDNEKSDSEFLKSRFGPDTPTVAELKKNVVLLLANAHPIFDGNRPVPPATVYLGAVHLQPKKDLPQDLKTYLDNSSRGVVYVSLGTNVRPSFMDKEFLDAFLEAFEKLPYDILWKFDGDNLENIPKNVKTQKWFPQRDLLDHPNLKVFVTQGGMQSMDEAIDAEVPLVGVPIFGDQWYNTNKYVEFGIGLDVVSHTMTANDLVRAVITVANDPSYKENMKKLKAFIQDQPEKGIDRAAWWIEHVLRHKSPRYLLGPGAQMSWNEYLMLDVVITLAATFSLALTIAVLAIFYIVRLAASNTNVKVKKN